MSKLIKDDEQGIKSLLESIPNYALLGLYITYISSKTRKAFNFKDLINDMKFEDSTSYDYIWGFIAACKAVGLIDFTLNKGIFNVVSINEHIVSLIENIFNERINNNEKEKIKSAVLKKETKDIVDNYF